MSKKRKKRTSSPKAQVSSKETPSNPPIATDDRQPGRNLPRVFWIAIAVLFGFYTLLGSAVLMQFPNSGDEHSYLLQAKIFAQGELSAPSLPESIREAFMVHHVVDNGIVCSKYTPGWPLALAVGELVGMPWLVGPLLGALFAAFVFLILRNLCGSRAAWFGMVLVGLSPFLAFQSASYMSHVGALFTQAFALWIISRRTDNKVALRSMLAGLAIGFGFLIRPLDGLLAGLAFLGWFGIRGIRPLIWFGTGVLPMIGVMLLYNKVQFGAPFTFGYEIYHPFHEQLYGPQKSELALSNVQYYVRHFTWLAELSAWIVPGMLVAMPFGAVVLWRKTEGHSRRVAIYCIAFTALLLLVLQATVPSVGDTYGPRYIMLLLLPIAIFSGAGIQVLGEKLRWSKPIWLSLIAICTLITVSKYIEVSSMMSNRIERRMRLQRVVEEKRPEQTVIFLKRTYRYGPTWYTRNEPGFKASVIYAVDRGPEKNLEVMEHFPGYKGVRFNWSRGRFDPLIPKQKSPAKSNKRTRRSGA